ERDGADYREAVVPIRTVLKGGLPAWRQGAPDFRRKQKARFIQQGDAGTALKSLAQDARPVIGYPAFHFLVVAFAWVFLGLLARPVQASFQQLAHMVGMVLDAKVAVNQHRHARCGPQMVGPTMND